MPIFNVSQVLGKALFVVRDIPFYKASDLANLVGTLRKGESFIVDSYLERPDAFYWTFYKGNALTTAGGRQYFSVRHDSKAFSFSKLVEQGTITDAQEIQIAKDKAKSIFDKVGEFFGGIGEKFGSGVQTIFVLGIILVSAMVLVPLFRKKRK